MRKYLRPLASIFTLTVAGFIGVKAARMEPEQVFGFALSLVTMGVLLFFGLAGVGRVKA